jgi:putative transposase
MHSPRSRWQHRVVCAARHSKTPYPTAWSVHHLRYEACDLEAHADVAGAWNLLQSEVGPIARPAALSVEPGRDAPLDEGTYWQWNDHEWTPAEFGEQSWSPNQPSVSEPASSQPG